MLSGIARIHDYYVCKISLDQQQLCIISKINLQFIVLGTHVVSHDLRRQKKKLTELRLSNLLVLFNYLSLLIYFLFLN